MIPSKIFLTGDTHGHIDINKLSSKNFKENKNLTKNDFVIILGDFGVLWNNTEDKQEKYLKKFLNDKNFTTLFIDGNHENHYRLNQLETTQFLNGKVGIVSDSIFHLKRGEIYTINNETFLAIGGATSYDKSHRIENISWWKDEVLSYKEQDYVLSNLEKHQYKVDHILAHTLPKLLASKFSFNQPYRNINNCSVSDFLHYIIEITDFKHYWCGHWHENITINNYHILYNKIINLDLVKNKIE